MTAEHPHVRIDAPSVSYTLSCSKDLLLCDTPDVFFLSQTPTIRKAE